MVRLSKFVVDVPPYPALFSCLAGFFCLDYCNWQGVDIQLQRVDDDDADRFHNIGLGLPSLTKLKGLD